MTFLLGVTLAAAMSGDTGIAPEVRATLGRDPPVWCDQAVRLQPRDEVWCAEPPPDCAGFVAACAQVRERAPSAPVDPPRSRIPRVGDTPVDVGLGWGVLGVVLVLVVAGLLGRRREVEVAEAAAEAAPSPAAAEAEAALVVAAPGWWAAAQRARDAGRWMEALLLARAGVVGFLEDRGRVGADPGRTDRELVRALGDDPAAQGDVRTLVSALERARYAGAPLARAVVDEALRAAARLTGVAAVLALLAPEAWAGAGARDLLPELLTDAGFAVDADAELAFEARAQLWIVDDYVSDTELADLRRALAAGAEVYAFGTGLLGEVDDLGLRHGGRADGAEVWAGYRGLAGGAVEEHRLILPDAGERVLGGTPEGWHDRAGEPLAAVIEVGAGRLHLVANDHLLDDGSLVRADNAAALLHLLGVGQAGATAALPFDDRGERTWPTLLVVDRGAEPPSDLQQLLRAGFGPFFFQLAAVWALWALARGRAFAARRPWIEAPPRAFSTHLRAVARFYRTTGSSRVGFAAVAARALPRLRAITGAGDLAGPALAAHVAARLGKDPILVRNLITRAEAALADPRGPPDDDEPWLTEALWTLVKQPTP